MQMQLCGDEGRNVSREDVLKVQVLLANIGERPGHGFWDGGLTGMGSEALVQAIAAFQRYAGLTASASGQMDRFGQAETDGTIRPNSNTWRALLDKAAPWANELRLLPNAQPPQAYWTKDLRRTTQSILSEFDRQKAISDQTLRQRFMQALLRVEHDLGLATGVKWVGLDRDLRVSARIEVQSLHVADPRVGRMAPLDGSSGMVPRALWQALDRVLQDASWTQAVGHHGTGGATYVTGQPLATQSEIRVGQAQFARCKVTPGQFQVEERILAGAIGLIAKLPSQDGTLSGRLSQIIDQVSRSDSRAAEMLEHRRNAMGRPFLADWMEYQDSETLIAVIQEYVVLAQYALIAGIVVTAGSYIIPSILASLGLVKISKAAKDAATRIGVPIAAISFMSMAVEKTFVSDLKAEVERRITDLDGSTGSIYGIAVPSGYTREGYLLEIFRIKALCVSDQERPQILNLMEQILLVGDDYRLAGNLNIKHRIERLYLSDRIAASALLYVFRLNSESANRFNLKYKPTAELKALFFKLTAAAVVKNAISVIGSVVDASPTSILEVAIFLTEK
jgi:hypothetical protein